MDVVNTPPTKICEILAVTQLTEDQLRKSRAARWKQLTA